MTRLEAISNPHTCSERAAIMEKAVDHQADETHSVDISFFSRLPWFLLNGPTYKWPWWQGLGLLIER